jgi:hypothetical protein
MIKLNAKISHFLLLSNHFIYCYEAYLMKYWLRDSWDQKHNCEHVFYVLKKNEPDLIMSLSAKEETSSYWLWVVQLTLQHQSADVEPERSEQIWRDSWGVSNLHFSLSCTQIADSTSARHCYSVIYTSGICQLCWCFLKVWSRMSLCT